MAVLTLDARQARRLFIASVGLADDRHRAASLSAVHALVRALGYVQVDSINVVERAHHLILWSRLAGYRRAQLTFLLEKRRALFEHWTHDASILPIEYFPYYRGRFDRDRARILARAWWRERITGGARRAAPDADAYFAPVLERFEREGPLGVGDFPSATKRPSGGFWGWTPEKAALEFLWRTGKLSVAHRTAFQKVYDLTHRVHPEAHRAPAPDEEAQHAWAFGEALARVGLATPLELAAFFQDADRHAAARWSRRAVAEGRAIDAEIVTPQGKRAVIVALDHAARVERARGASAEIRLLCPFDPLLRDRARVKLLFGIDFRFEGFVPKAARTHGYYVMAALEGDEIVAKIDPKLDRARSALVIQNVWWTPGFGGSPARRRALEDAAAGLARWLGASRIEWRPTLSKQGAR